MFKIPSNIARTVFLTEVELQKLRDKEINIERLDIVRDLFLFLCNTGMEFKDLDNLTTDDISTINDRKYIIKNRVKQDQETQAIPLLNEAQVLIKKYSTGAGRIFPKRSNQRLNTYLKELAAICDINKELTTIVARHTFATRMLTEGLPIETVSHILGHASVKPHESITPNLLLLKSKTILTG
jgi:site-specific recombinase XerD